MATTPALLSIDEYLRTSYKPDADFVNGELEERNVGEHTHNFIQGLLYYLFTLNTEAWGTEAIVEQRIRVGPDHVRVCDVAVIGVDDSFEEVLTVAPMICIEILSPEDRIPRAELVLADYLAMGVANIWLIDPIRRIAYTFNATGLQRANGARLSVPGTPIQLDLTEFFAKLDKRTGSRNDR